MTAGEQKKKKKKKKRRKKEVLMDSCQDDVEKKLNAAMPWIGIYIAAASTICTLAMAADLFNGFRLKKLWFPSKFFSINAASLTVLAVAVKLSVDINTNMINADIDFFAKLTSIMFMLTTLTNFMSSFGSMTNKEVLANGLALAIFVITVSNNVGIQLIELRYYLGDTIMLIPTIIMLVLLMIAFSLAVTVPSMKRTLEQKYQEKHQVALRDEATLERRNMMKYMVMAESSSPQFVMARSVVCSSAVIFLLGALLFVGDYIILSYSTIDSEKGGSPYGNSTKWIVYIQFTGIALGTIAPAFRWLVAVSFKCATYSRHGFTIGINIEDYWIQTLVDWRDMSFLGLQIRHNKFRKYLHLAKWFIFTFLIGIQILVVLSSKLNLFLSALFMTPFFNCYTLIKKFVKQTGHDESGDDDDMIEDLRSYVLLLEGEAELPRRVLKNIILQADQLIQKGRKKQPLSLLDLLRKFANLNGSGQFDRIRIPGVHSQEPPNRWRLPVITLATIAIAIPNIRNYKRKQLLNSVSEGLSLAKIVEETLFQNAKLINIRKAADTYWVNGVVFYKRWMDTDLREMSRYNKSWNETLQNLYNKADKIVMDFEKQVHGSVFQNPLSCPPKIVAANSMRSVCQTILVSCEAENEQTDEGMFELLSVMIADILAACLKHLPQAITTMCHSNVIEERETTVRKAFHLLGETEQVVELLQQNNG